MAAPSEEDEDSLALDYYSLLNVNKEATSQEINNAFRKLSRLFHPDKHIDPAKKKYAESMFGKLKKAHEVLTDTHRRAVYDTYGEKGLEMEGMEVVSRTKTPAEIMAEYERFQREQEERRLQQRTNPKGTVSVGVDATNVFDSYDMDMEYSAGVPSAEISSMSIYQSVECPLTVKDTAVIAGTLSTQNGTGTGAFMASWRRLTSDKGWAEVEGIIGNSMAVSMKGFRQLTKRCYGTSVLALQATPRGIRPALATTLACQLDKNVQGRVVWNAGFPSSMSTAIVYDTQKHHAVFSIQFGVPNTFLSLSYMRKFQESEAKLRGAVKVGTLGAVVEYGFEKKVSQFSVLGATVAVGVPVGVTVRVRMHRGQQTFVFPIHLSEQILPSAIFYGTVIPMLTFFTVKKLIVDPFIQEQKKRELEKKREEYAEKLAEKKREAQAAVELMRETVERSVESEERRSGLIISKAFYGKLASVEERDLADSHCIDVVVPLQAFVKESKLILEEYSTKSDLPGFYDPCIGEDKKLYIRYRFRKRYHQVTLNDNESIRLPQEKHLMQDDPGPSGAMS
ncbi:hypothetical protein ScPMuIL_008173 [Solemya velum]